MCDNGKCDVSFDSETGVFTLTISSVQHYDVGFYTCMRQSQEHAAHLVVLESTATNPTQGMKM